MQENNKRRAEDAERLADKLEWDSPENIALANEMAERLQYYAPTAAPAVDAVELGKETRIDLTARIAELEDDLTVSNDAIAHLRVAADPEQAKLDSLAQAGLAAALENHAAGGTDDAEDVFSQDDVIDLLQHELIIDSGAMFLRAGSSMSFDLDELTLFANHAAKVARQPQAAPEVIAMLLDVARAAWHAMDNTEENEHGKVWDAPDFDALSAAMDKLDALPDNRPGYVMGPAAKAEWAMRAIRAAPEATSEQMGGAQVAKLDKQKLRELAEFWAGKYHSSYRAIRVGNQAAWDELVAYVESIATPTTESAAEGEATERKPLTEPEALRIMSMVIDRCPTLAKASNQAIFELVQRVEQHHGITGGDKNG